MNTFQQKKSETKSLSGFMVWWECIFKVAFENVFSVVLKDERILIEIDKPYREKGFFSHPL